MVRTRWKWEARDLFTLEEKIYEGWSDAAIGRLLGCTAYAVNIARKRHRIPPRRKVVLTARVVARRLGLGCDKTVARWIRKGYLRGRRGQGCGLNRMWYITEGALLDFLENPAYWHLWELAKVGVGLRAWVYEMRDGVRFLTTGQVAERHHVTWGTVNSWIRKGYLPAVRRGNWLIKEGDLSGFVIPCERPRKLP